MARPFKSCFKDPEYTLFLHKCVTPLTHIRACREVMEKHPERATELYPVICDAQELFTRYMEEVLSGWHTRDAPPEFVACARDVYDRSRGDWTNGEVYAAFEKWLAEKFP